MALGIDLGSFDSKMVELVESNDFAKLFDFSDLFN